MHAVDAWGECHFCSAMMRFLSRVCAELSALCFQWASKPMMGKILCSLRTNDTCILLDSIYLEKENVLLVDVDIVLISTGGDMSRLYSIRHVFDVYIKFILIFSSDTSKIKNQIEKDIVYIEFHMYIKINMFMVTRRYLAHLEK